MPPHPTTQSNSSLKPTLPILPLHHRRTNPSPSPPSPPSESDSIPLTGLTIPLNTNATLFGKGGGPVRRIPMSIEVGDVFRNRMQGGGRRGDVFGSRSYGVVLPNGTEQRGMDGLDLPFYFFPVTWGSGNATTPAYLNSTEYGHANNTSRPGGPLTTISFPSFEGNSTYNLVSDNLTITTLLPILSSTCYAPYNVNRTLHQPIVPFKPIDYNANSNNTSNTGEINTTTTQTANATTNTNTANTHTPKPEEALQYYRGCSVVLTLQSYTDTTTLNASSTYSSPHTPIPVWADINLLNCLNDTIGGAVVLVRGEGGVQGVGAVGVVGVVVLVIVIVVLVLVGRGRGGRGRGVDGWVRRLFGGREVREKVRKVGLRGGWTGVTREGKIIGELGRRRSEKDVDVVHMDKARHREVEGEEEEGKALKEGEEWESDSECEVVVGMDEFGQLRKFVRESGKGGGGVDRDACQPEAEKLLEDERPSRHATSLIQDQESGLG